MTSFLTHRAHVHNVRLPLRRRHSALRTCITLFAPYGFRATYHHLTLSAAIPRRLEADPEALVRAVEELHEARVLWLARAQEYAAQRRAEKGAGRRAVPNPRPWWLRSRGRARTAPGAKTRSDTRHYDCPSTSGGRTRFWTVLCLPAARPAGMKDRGN
ncbi:hypothetical protein [Streptomyces sp. RKAG290]|uniref:hypothetical protein n=1 Tax=Streptomyces sp. RKAG290 TaxID=2888348 RepID=UPI0020334CE8|nr:hypothetical protein [Streptomyces sp. RKAG290]MCM2416354.1 hypothetical protein [Streptomyces sp. RKAG290]